MMTDQGVYMYAVSRGLTTEDVSPIDGLRGEPLRLVTEGDLSAVVSTVSLDEFGDEGLHRNLEDLAWLEEVARAHDDVVTRVAQSAVTAPLRLATICLGDEGVRARLQDQQNQLTAVLDRVEGRAEWSVKAYHHAPKTPVAASASPQAPETGAAYLQRRRAERTRTVQDTEAGEQLAEEVHRMVSGLAVASRRLPPQDPRLAGHEGTMTLNGTYLLAADRGDQIRELVAGISAEHPEADVTLGGPWPPYSFATQEDP